MILKKTNSFPTIIMFLGLILTLLFSIRYGAVEISLSEILSAFNKIFLNSNSTMNLNESIFMEIRLPRAILCVFVGASLAVGGTLMQALFRNPIVEPGLIGTSSGAALGSAFYIVLESTFSIHSTLFSLPFSAFIGALISTFLVYILSFSKEYGKSSLISILLIGIAINALFMSAVGFLSYIARDPQARSITFWGLGTLSGANWNSVYIVAFTSIFCITLSIYYAKQLNALMIGEEEAQYLGVNIQKLKIIILLINVLLIAVATAFVGIISFVGLIIPHILRMISGSDNRNLIINSAILGAIFLSIADLIARILLKPAELPIGIITSWVGVPILIYLIRRKKYLF